MMTTSRATYRMARLSALFQTGFGKRPKRNPNTTRYERQDTFWSANRQGAHMPIDVGIHWEWSNPLNVIPLSLLLLLIIGLVGILV